MRYLLVDFFRLFKGMGVIVGVVLTLGWLMWEDEENAAFIGCGMSG